MKKYLKRHIDKELEIWAKSQERKPLLLRGARQVGKTSAVRHLAEEFEYFAEVDFNERPDIHYIPQFGIVQTTNPNCLHYFP